ncbi:MAG: endonuclease/exonuclease/phosphatase family protein [Candidatus Roizmanbacteria bacterium]|nr:MAG: endonuclease/exonuclease/phosphatase family protein [Candidatus Roizmanbacteria bacterium]
MAVSLLTYNVCFNSALNNFEKVFSLTRPDILSLQEIETNEKNLKDVEKHGYKLADYSNSFIKFDKIYGLATFYNPKTIEFLESSSFNLPRSYHEFFLVILRGGNNPRTVLKTKFSVKGIKKIITSYNLHLSYLGTNGIRTKQMKATLDDMHLSRDENVLIAGDFNYPYQRKQFEELIEKYKLKEATNNLNCTFEGKFLKIFPLKWKLDYILYKNLELIETKKIPLKASDHFPILSRFK